VPSARIAMNYLKVYCKLIRKEEENKLTRKEAKSKKEYLEGHHVFPRSIYGENGSGNTRVVYVSPRVHYILHVLLEKAFMKRYGVEHWKTKKMTFAHIMLKGHDIHEKYINSHLYDAARRRHSKNMKNVKKSEEMKRKLSLAKKGKYTGRDSSGAIPIRVYFDDGNIVEYLDGIHNFSKEYNYPLQSLKNLRDLKIKSYKNILKIEKFPRPPKKKKIKNRRFGMEIHNTIPIRIYFIDGRVLDYPDGATHFAKNNPQYDFSALSRMRRGTKLIHKDIIKIEEIIEGEVKPIKPIKIKYPNLNVVPIKVYFEDGKVIEELGGMAEFSRKYPNYIASNISALGLNKIKKYKDIIKVERLRSAVNVLF
jgi:hypothetical protein